MIIKYYRCIIRVHFSVAYFTIKRPKGAIETRALDLLMVETLNKCS